MELDEYRKGFKDCSELKWVSKKFLDRCEEIIKHIWMEDVQKGDGVIEEIGKNIYEATRAGEKYYGKSVPTFTKELEDELALLAGNKKLEVLDIGAGKGMTIWRELLSGANVTATDISYENYYKKYSFEKFVKERVPEDVFEKSLTILDNNIFDIDVKNSKFQGKFDIVNMQNVIHFYCPREIKFMIKSIYDFLKPGGVAVITANSVNLRGGECRDTYEEAVDKGDPFPGYIKVIGGHCQKIDYRYDRDTCPFKQEFIMKDGQQQLMEIWNDFDPASLEKLFDKDKFDAISTSYYFLSERWGHSGTSLSISARKKSFDVVENGKNHLDAETLLESVRNHLDSKTLKLLDTLSETIKSLKLAEKNKELCMEDPLAEHCLVEQVDYLYP